MVDLINKEIEEKSGISLEIITKQLITKIREEENKIMISETVLRELDYKLKRFMFLRNFLKKYSVESIKIFSYDIDAARMIEKENNYIIGFFDCIHIAACKRTKSILVTRDKELINIAKRYIKVFTPEEILHQAY